MIIFCFKAFLLFTFFFYLFGYFFTLDFSDTHVRTVRTGSYTPAFRGISRKNIPTRKAKKRRGRKKGKKM